MAKKTPTQAQSSFRINSQQRGISPDVKVYVQEVSDDLFAGSKLVELKGWSSIQVNQDVESPLRCSITFPNMRDKYFRKQQVRTYSEVDKTITRNYLLKVLGLAAASFREVNPYRRDPAVGKFSKFRSNKDRVLDYIDSVYSYGTAIDDKLASSANRENIISLGLMQRIWVDVKGRDGLWYAVFSGLVSNINDSLVLQSEPTITLQCVGLMRLLQLTQVYTQQAVSIREQTRAVDILNSDPSAQNILKSTVLAGKSGTEALRFLVNLAQISFSFNAYRDFVNQSNQQQRLANRGSANAANLTKDDFFYLDPFWKLPDVTTDQFGNTDVKGSFEGRNNLRRHASFEPGTEVIPETTTVKDLQGSFEIDKFVSQGPQAEAFKLMIRSGLDLFQSTRQDAFSLSQTIAKLTFYEFLETPGGDLVFQIPKLNNFPGDFGKPNVSSGSTVYDFGTEGEWDYGPAPENFTQKGHGNNYIVSDASVISWSISDAEGGLVTHVEASSDVNLTQQSELMLALAGYGRTSVTRDPELRKLQARFGLRIFEPPKVVLREMNTTSSARAAWDAYAKAVLIRVNAKAKSVQLAVNMRPDIKPGQNMFMVERGLLGYVTGVSHQIRWGSSIVSNIQLEYVHDLGTRILNPWISVRGVPPSTSRPGTDGLTEVQRTNQTQFGFIPRVVPGSFTPETFIRESLAAADIAAAELSQQSKQLMIAHACVETGFGRKIVGNNLFNITANPGSNWRGPTLVANDPLHGKARPQVFRAYADFQSSIDDYLTLLQTSRYIEGYNQLINNDPVYIETIGKKGYYEVTPAQMRLAFNSTLSKIQKQTGVA